MTAPSWQPHPTVRGVWTLDLGLVRLSANESGWWCMGHKKKQPAPSLEGAQVKALLWARAAGAQFAAALEALGGST